MTKHRNELYPFTRRRFLRVIGGSAAALALAACGQAPPQTTTPSTPAASGNEEKPATTPTVAVLPQRGGSLRIAFAGVATMLDPTLIYAVEDTFAALAMYEPLVLVDSNLKVHPALATVWHEADDGLSWTFTLREGVTFHDGSPFGAEDVVYTFQRILNPDTGAMAHKVLDGIASVVAMDEQTVRFDLKRPRVEFLPMLSFAGVSIVQRNRDTEALQKEPIGTGPFTFAELLPGERLRMTRNENYWKPDLPYLDEVQHLYLPEVATRMEALNSGVVDVICNLEIEQIPIIENNTHLRLLQGLDVLYQPIILNVKHSPMDDARVRKALKFCVDRAGMVQAVTQGRGSITNDQPVFAWHSMYADIPPKEQDVAQAKALLAEAGYADGLTLTMATAPLRPGMHESAVAFQEMAQQAGVTIELKQFPAETYWGEYLKYPLSVSNGGFIFPSMDANLAVTYHSAGAWQEPGYKNEELDRLMEQASAEQDEQKRKDMYEQIQHIISDDGGWIIPYSRPFFVANHSTVHDVDVVRQVFYITGTWKEQDG
jgi:peptide/nickel transport system substrate-binding protein